MITLKVVLEHVQSSQEEQIIVKYHQVRPGFLKLLDSISVEPPQQNNPLTAYRGGDIYPINPEDVFHIKMIDKKPILHCANEKYESAQRLCELEETLPSHDFMRVSKSTILNLRKIKSYTPMSHEKLEAVLQNGEKVIIARWFVKDFKKKLGI